MKTQNSTPLKSLDQLDAPTLSLTEDFGFGYSAGNCSGGGGSCRSCGGGCYGCYTPAKSADKYGNTTATTKPKVLR